MPRIARSLPRTSRIPILHTQCRLPCRRHFSDAPSTPQWFYDLRTEMLGRELPPLFAFLTPKMLRQVDRHILAAHVPPSWIPDTADLTFFPPSYHQAFHHHDVDEKDLLRDGTDSLHSPGGDFVRRVWASGELRIDLEQYYSDGGWRRNKRTICFETIKDVRLRGKADEEKIIVTIGRTHVSIKNTHAKDWEAVLQKVRDERRWETSAVQNSGLEEQRTLIFMKARADNGELLPPTKYLQPPATAEFQHTLTPTPTLLFRFSALTLNAHALHLDAEYTRQVEGHRNLLVHGPLQLTLILRFVEQHLRSLPGPPQTIRLIHYRNLAPLYVNEKMTLCGSAHGRRDNVIEAWIEGPSGGMAFKAVIHTAPLPETTIATPPVAAPAAKAPETESMPDHSDYDWWATMSSTSPADDHPSSAAPNPAEEPYVRTEPMRIKISPLTAELVQRLRLRNPMIRLQEKAYTRAAQEAQVDGAEGQLVRTYGTTREHRSIARRVRTTAPLKINYRASFDAFRRVVRVPEIYGNGGTRPRRRMGRGSGSEPVARSAERQENGVEMVERVAGMQDEMGMQEKQKAAEDGEEGPMSRRKRRELAAERRIAARAWNKESKPKKESRWEGRGKTSRGKMSRGQMKWSPKRNSAAEEKAAFAERTRRGGEGLD